MRQLELPFTKRGRRDFRRLHNTNPRAFKCWHRLYPDKFYIIHACDRTEARKAFMEKFKETGLNCGYIDTLANRAPEHDISVGTNPV